MRIIITVLFSLSAYMSSPVFSNTMDFVLRDSLVNYSKLFLNTPYKYGAAGTSHFDCSGFTYFVFKHFDYHLPRSSSEQIRRIEEISLHKLQQGDLVFYQGRNRNNSRVGHVGIVVDTDPNGTFNFIHASTSGGVTITNSQQAYYSERFIKAGRIIKDTYPIGNENVVATSEVLEAVNENQFINVEPAVYHKVVKGETLSSISRKYGISVGEIKLINNLKSNTIRINDYLKIVEEKIFADQLKIEINLSPDDFAEVFMPESTKGSNLTHSVRQGETLYSIAKKYNVMVDRLKEMNNMQSDQIEIGQELIVVEKISDKREQLTVSGNIEHVVQQGETLYVIAKKYSSTIEDIKSVNGKTSNSLHIGELLIIPMSN